MQRRERLHALSGLNMAIQFLRLAVLSLACGSWRSADAFVLVPITTSWSFAGGATARGSIALATNSGYSNARRSRSVLATFLSQQVDGDKVALSGEESPEAAAEDVVTDAGTEAGVEDDGASKSAVGTQRQPRERERQRNTMFVGNLSFDATDEEIRELFGQYGKVELVNIPRDRKTGEPRGFAFVDMSSPEEVEAAMSALDGYALGTRRIRVSKSVSKSEVGKQAPASYQKYATAEGTTKLYVGNIPFETTLDEITAHYQAFGEVLEAYIPNDRSTGKGRGFAFVTMKNEDALRALRETNGALYEGRKLVVSTPLPPGEKAPPRKPNRVKLYVGNLSFYTIADTLVEVFSEFGTVHDCYLPEDSATGSTRGFGFVTMDKENALQAVAELDGCEIDGRKIRVNQAQPKGEAPVPEVKDEESDDMDFDPELP